jgi:phage pi2 protein 07
MLNVLDFCFINKDFYFELKELNKIKWNSHKDVKKKEI